MRARGIALVLVLTVCMTSSLWAQSKSGDKSSTALYSLSEIKIGSGFKEVLKASTTNTVAVTGRVDGYFRNQTITILMPRELQVVETGLRSIGYGPQVDELVLSMNRAAEKAAPYAKDIFWSAIADMTMDDIRRVLSGDTSATQYFQRKTTQTLTAIFTPIVDRSMHEVGATQQYQELLRRYQTIPFINSVSFDLTQYVVGKALDGLFHVLGEEEKKLRKNSAARATSLLQEVLGR